MMRYLSFPENGPFYKSIVGAAPVFVAALLLVAAPATAQRARTTRAVLRDSPGTIVLGEVIISAKPGIKQEDLTASLTAAGLQIVRPMRLRGYYLARVTTADGKPASEQATQTAASSLRNTGKFNYARANHIVRKMDTTPNDPLFKQQWHHTVMNMPQAWDLAKGDPATILVDLDTGVDSAHPDLAANILTGVNFTVTPNTTNTTDGDGHGTHTSGIMGAVTNNGVGVAGVSFGTCKIFPAKVLDDSGSGTDEWISNGLIYVADNVKTPANNVVINMSLGAYTTSDTPDLSDPIEAAVFYAASQRNCVVVMSAGNAFDQGNPAASPARTAQLHPNLFCVGACGAQKEHSFFSESRSYTTISAPGGDDPSFSSAADEVLSTLPTSQGSYGVEQGTSMAAPCISGVCAVLLSTGIGPDQLKAIITSTADPVNRSVPNADFGFGVVDAAAAVNQASSGVSIISPSVGGFVFGSNIIQLNASDPSKFLGAELRIGKGTTVVASVGASGRTLTWNTQATDPATGAPLYPNGTYSLKIKVTTPSGPANFTRQVKVDNPIAQITTPAGSGFVTKTATIVGTADGLRKPTYTVEFATAQAPSTWTPILANQTAIIQAGTLATWDLSNLPDGAVTLRLRVKNPDGFEVSDSHAITIDQTPPTAPTNVTGTPGHLQATLGWGASTDNFLLVGYNVYRSNKSLSGFTKVIQTTQTTYVDPNLSNGTTYFYKITAVDGAGNESPLGKATDVTPNRNGIATGVVNATDGTFLSGVHVKVLKNGTVISNGTATTDSSGQYTFPAPPGFAAGTYDVQANGTGYVPQVIHGVTVDFGVDAVGKNFVLQPQPVIPSGWSMFTIPYDFGGSDLTSVFTASAGNVRAYIPATGAYVLPGDPAFPKPAAGIGYWVNNSGGTSPSITGAGVPNTSKLSATVPIHRGWNLVGNPFQDQVRWQLNDLVITRADNGQEASLSQATNLGWGLDFAWGGKNGKTLIYDSSVIPGIPNTIPAFGAFWYRSEVEGTLRIAPPSVVGRAAVTPPAMNQWTAQITAASGSDSSSVYVGIGSKHRVFPAPPSIVKGVTIALAADAVTAASGTAGSGYAVDLQTPTTSHTWNLAVTGTDDKPITVSWPSASSLPRGWRLALVDPATGQRVSLQTTSSYTFSGGRAAHALQLELTRAAANDRVLVSNLAVNATRSTSPVISFHLSAPGDTTVSIIRANGQSIRTLSSRAAQAGDTSLVWDTRDNSGKAVPPGVYLVQVRTVGEKGDQAKAILPFIVTR